MEMFSALRGGSGVYGVLSNEMHTHGWYLVSEIK